ncbi:MAG TPA: Mov34/MPN/PAD-1 family protein, partial [Patescibacteria group bacterium]|nr:Mov34/MPN/PAD-1 family protein [Patescibacteria group bacterium]
NEMARISHEDYPNETGGVLIGNVSYTNTCMTIVDLIPAPSDSVKKPVMFKLGTVGLKRVIKHIERRSKGIFTYLGTWHSHPDGGGQSDTDKETLTRITFLRDYEPTVCAIWTPSGISVVA